MGGSAVKDEPETLASLLSLSVLKGAKSFEEGLQPEHMVKVRGVDVIEDLGVRLYRNGWKRIVKICFTWGYRAAESERMEQRRVGEGGGD